MFVNRPAAASEGRLDILNDENAIVSCKRGDIAPSKTPGKGRSRRAFGDISNRKKDRTEAPVKSVVFQKTNHQHTKNVKPPGKPLLSKTIRRSQIDSVPKKRVEFNIPSEFSPSKAKNLQAPKVLEKSRISNSKPAPVGDIEAPFGRIWIDNRDFDDDETVASLEGAATAKEELMEALVKRHAKDSALVPRKKVEFNIPSESAPSKNKNLNGKPLEKANIKKSKPAPVEETEAPFGQIWIDNREFDDDEMVVSLEGSATAKGEVAAILDKRQANDLAPVPRKKVEFNIPSDSSPSRSKNLKEKPFEKPRINISKPDPVGEIEASLGRIWIDNREFDDDETVVSLEGVATAKEELLAALDRRHANYLAQTDEQRRRAISRLEEKEAKFLATVLMPIPGDDFEDEHSLSLGILDDDESIDFAYQFQPIPL